MATVHLAEDLRPDRRVAIKVLKPELAAVIGGERFVAEIKTTAALQHPHVRVIDDGSEIPADLLPRIFDSFFTTKPPGQGTGLGLDISRRLLRQYRGDLTVESRPGRTVFRASLPAAPPVP